MQKHHPRTVKGRATRAIKMLKTNEHLNCRDFDCLFEMDNNSDVVAAVVQHSEKDVELRRILANEYPYWLDPT